MRVTDQLWFRFALWVSGFVLLIWLAFSVLTFFLFRGRLDEALDASLELSASQALAAVNIEDGFLNLSDSIPDPGSLSSMPEDGFLVQIVDGEGHIQLASGDMDIDPVSIPVIAASSTPFFFSSTLGTRREHRFRAISAPIMFDGRQLGAFRIFRGLASVDDALDGLLATLLAVLPFFVLLSFIGTTLIARRSLLPVRRMMETATRISDSDLAMRLPVSRREDEVGRLARVFNELLDRLEHAFEREKRFTADAAHELRTPLTALQAIVSATLAHDRDAESYRRALQDAGGQVNRLVRLSNDLLHLARQGEWRLSEGHAFDLALLAEDACAGLAALAEKKRIDLVFSGTCPAQIVGDRDAVARALFNVIGNAIKFTESGSVSVSVGLHGVDGIALSVTDTGIGIGAEHLPHIFDRFYRVSPSRAGDGTGLGLALAAGIVASHHGHIEVESHPGKGSTFTIVLPRDVHST